MVKSNDVIKKDIKEHKTNWPSIPDHPCRILTIRGPGSRKTNFII